MTVRHTQDQTNPDKLEHFSKNFQGQCAAIQPFNDRDECETVVLEGASLREIDLLARNGNVGTWVYTDFSIETLMNCYMKTPVAHRHKVELVLRDATDLFERIFAEFNQKKIDGKEVSFASIVDRVHKILREARTQQETCLTGRATVWISSLVSSQLPPYLIKFIDALCQEKFRRPFPVESIEPALILPIHLRHLEFLSTKAQVVYFADTFTTFDSGQRLIKVSVKQANEKIDEAQNANQGKPLTQEKTLEIVRDFGFEKVMQKVKDIGSLTMMQDLQDIRNFINKQFTCTSSRKWRYPTVEHYSLKRGDDSHHHATVRYKFWGVEEYILTPKEDPKEDNKSPS